MHSPLATDETRFFEAYERLSRDGQCDSPGGMEYERVLSEWHLFGQPAELDTFIRLRANAGPSGVDNA